jgi:hypothetical protein
MPAPKKWAITASLTKPRIRLKSVPIPMVEAALVIACFSDMKGGWNPAHSDGLLKEGTNERSKILYLTVARHACAPKRFSAQARTRSRYFLPKLDTPYPKMLKKSIN